MGLIATRSLDTPVTGIKDLKREHEARIRNGIKAYAALQRVKGGDRSPEAAAELAKLKADLGYGLLLRKYAPNVVDATPEQIRSAVRDTIPRVAPLFWSFRIMVGAGIVAGGPYLCAKSWADNTLVENANRGKRSVGIDISRPQGSS